jgi:hypothetical protein
LTIPQTAKKKRPAVYTGDSQASKFHCQSYWRKAATGCPTITSFFPNLQLILQQSYQMETNYLQADPVGELGAKIELDLMHFCIGKLEDECGTESQKLGDGELSEFEVSIHEIYSARNRLIIMLVIVR